MIITAPKMIIMGNMYKEIRTLFWYVCLFAVVCMLLSFLCVCVVFVLFLWSFTLCVCVPLSFCLFVLGFFVVCFICLFVCCCFFWVFSFWFLNARKIRFYYKKNPVSYTEE